MNTFFRIWKIKEVRNSILFIISMLIIFRITAHVPVPGIDASALENIFSGNQFYGLLDIFSGGNLKSFSIVAMGVMPYITSSIIFQLLGMIVPQIEEMQKEEQGRQKINQWTRLATIPLGFIQAYGLILLLSQQGQFFTQVGFSTILFAMVSMIAGTMFLVWIGELISEKNIGNGISIIILSGIVAGLPTFLTQYLVVYDSSQLITFLLFIAVAILTVVSIVVMHEAQRNIPVQYARAIQGSRLTGAVSSHIPMRLNMGGVIPIIFAISIILFPTVIAQFFLNAKTEFLRTTATWTLQVFQNQVIYGILYFVLVFLFAYFYTAVIFHPEEVAENIQKQGGFIPGIRPGKQTADYLSWVVNRLLLSGALFLSIIAVLPIILQQVTGNTNLVIGGTSVLIIVAVVIDSVKQIQAQLTMREYEI
ncbi:MAG: Protein translocase subunit SecY [Candidatus Uhrbacteria bacterium GW2011_GWF2_39_13]|uniref:Protein translocase subunit SecY n=1 Tax=Candidatus Uhrbacteria bacterium GW2011_GWF2_39_13 TaxID=1618995 RepID=A0A0G0Q072_9BACT|nr:MAG: Protein translocase subunit SecY [Candidatus Uhrbacteria bacterium GW2011_GWF2_39_13]HAU66750.1 preprotein translocase subunit SecY [Candidatus Uhrbacteria bacterium]